MPTIPNYRELPKRDLTIYLLKATVTVDDVRGRLHEMVPIPIQAAGIAAQLYVRQDQRPDLPQWARLFEGQLPDDGLGQIASLSALLLIEVAARRFCIVFGSGRFLLDDDWYEDRFGFLAVLNLVDSKQIKTIDKRTLDALGRQTRVQATKATGVREFGVDYERDLVRAVVGKPKEPDLGTFVTGTASLRTSVRIDLPNVPRLLAKYLEKSEGRAYAQEFPGIDQLKAVTSPDKLAELDAEVVRRLRAGEIDELSLAMPQIVDWHSLSTFRYDGIDDGVDHNELDLRELMQIAQQAQVDWTVERLSRVRIRVINSDGIPVERWSMHGCLFGEIRYQGVNWILSSGSWYQVSQGLVQEVERAFATVRQLHPRLPVYSDNDEEAYCVRVADQHESWARMDRVPIRFGQGRSLVEFCDLFNREEKVLLHVKRYGGSAPLSHLFQQALVSGEAFRTESEFRRLANAKLPQAYRLANPAVPPEGYTVALGIVKSNPFDLPFFAKVTLRNTVRLLRGFGFEVRLAHINVQAQWARIVRPRRRNRAING